MKETEEYFENLNSREAEKKYKFEKEFEEEKEKIKVFLEIIINLARKISYDN